MDNNLDYLSTKKRITKGFVIGLIICIVINCLITFLVAMTRISNYPSDNIDYLVSFTDGFTVSGGLMSLFYLLVFVSDEGAFDIISYSIQLVWNVTFHKSVKDTKLPKTYAEYRALKRSKPRLDVKFILYSGLLFLLIGIVLWIIYRVNL